MDKRNFMENDIDVEDFIDTSAQTNGQGNARKTKKHSKKLWISLTATVMALLVAVGAFSISFAAPAQDKIADASPVALTLSQASEEQGEQSASGVYLLDVSDIVNDALPSVVSVTSRSLINYYGNSNGGYYGGNGNFGDIWEYFFGDSFGGRGSDRYYSYPEPAEDGEEAQEDETPNEIESGLGSGTIIAMDEEELLILTSYHVVEGSSSLYVTFINDESVDGYIKSALEDKDIAIVAVPLADIDQETLDSIKVATIATEAPEVGDGVIVIGNALGYGISVTTGIVSALDRDIYVEGKTLTVLQTDAAINSGNSGGCMLNSRGEIIGINEAKVKMSYVEGMCYAIPVVSNLELIEDLVNSEGITTTLSTEAPNVFLGIRGRDVTIDISNDYGMPLGIYVSETVQGSGAQEAGIQGGDIIVSIDGTEVTTMEELQYELAQHEAGDEVTIEVMRMTEGSYVSQEIDVVLTDRIS